MGRNSAITELIKTQNHAAKHKKKKKKLTDDMSPMTECCSNEHSRLGSVSAAGDFLFFICYTELCNFTCVWLSKYVELCNCSSAPFNSSTECSGHIYNSSFWDVQKMIGVITGSKFDCVIFYTLQSTDRFLSSFVLFLGFKRWMKPHALCKIPAHFLPYLTERQKGVFDFSPEKISWMFTLLGATRFWPSVLIMRKSRSKP